MSFKTHQMGPRSAQSAEYIFEGELHQQIKVFLPKKQQGKVMGAFRAALANYVELKARVAEHEAPKELPDYWDKVPDKLKYCYEKDGRFAYNFEETDDIVYILHNSGGCDWVPKTGWTLVAERL